MWWPIKMHRSQSLHTQSSKTAQKLWLSCIFLHADSVVLHVSHCKSASFTYSALLIYTVTKTSSQNTRRKDKASQTVRNAIDASSYNLYKQTAAGFFLYAEINLNGGITGKRCITNPSPPLLYAQWNNIFTKSSCRAALENREDGLSWNKGNTLTYKTKTKDQKPRRQERQGECGRKMK